MSAVERGAAGGSEHVIQFYDSESMFIAEVGRAMTIALDQGSAVVCIATDEHRHRLEDLLVSRGVDVAAVRIIEQMVCLDAPRALAKITVDGLPDAIHFAQVIGSLIDRLVARYPRVWVFGELVALMCANDNYVGAVKLERLWRSFTESRPVVLYCAYPANAFSCERDLEAFLHVCEEHCRVLHSESTLALSVRRTERSPADA